jgi:hypothetical protein
LFVLLSYSSFECAYPIISGFGLRVIDGVFFTVFGLSLPPKKLLSELLMTDGCCTASVLAAFESDIFRRDFPKRATALNFPGDLKKPPFFLVACAAVCDCSSRTIIAMGFETAGVAPQSPPGDGGESSPHGAAGGSNGFAIKAWFTPAALLASKKAV